MIRLHYVQERAFIRYAGGRVGGKGLYDVGKRKIVAVCTFPAGKRAPQMKQAFFTVCVADGQQFNQCEKRV